MDSKRQWVVEMESKANWITRETVTVEATDIRELMAIVRRDYPEYSLCWAERK